MDKSSFAGRGVDLAHCWRVLLIHKWRIVAVAAAVGVAVALVLQIVQPVYRATTTLLIEGEQARTMSEDSWRAANPSSRDYFLTEFEILKSRELAERTVKRLRLAQHPLFDPRQQQQTAWLQNLRDRASNLLPQSLRGGDAGQNIGDDEALDRVVQRFSDSLRVEPVKDTKLVKLHFYSVDPALAASAVNTLADVYIESHLEASLDATQRVTSWLGERLGDLREKLQQSEASLQEYREAAELVDLDGVQTIDAEQLEQLSQRLVETRDKRAQAETTYTQVNKLGSSPSVEQLLTIPSILRHPVVEKLKQEQSEAYRLVKELSARYKHKHPKMINALMEAESSTSDLELQALRVANGIATDYRAALRNERSLELQLEQAKDRLQSLNRKEFRLRELEREVASNRHLYEMFLTRYKEADESVGFQAAHARVVDMAGVPRDPVQPDRQAWLLWALGLSALLSVIVVLVRDAYNNTIRTPEDVEEKLEINLLGFLPEVKQRKGAAGADGFLAHADDDFAESMRSIRTGIMMSGMDSPNRVIVVTSSVPEEGKSTVAMNLAESLAQMERVLLIDGDMRRPTLGKRLGLPRTSAGLANVVLGTVGFKECVHTIKDTGVDVLTAGISQGNPLELLSTQHFAHMIETLGEQYDRIIIDSAPAIAVSDAMVLSGYADAVVYVVKYDCTAAPLAKRGIKKLREADASLAGVVLNRVDVNRASKYGSYYEGYYKSYGYSSESGASVADFRKALEKRASAV